MIPPFVTVPPIEYPQIAVHMCADANVHAVVKKHLDRARTGLKKYGVTTERTDLTRQEWLQHLQDELMDAAVYAQVLMSKLSDTPAEEYEAFVKARWQGHDLNYCVLALSGEAGELANAYKKHTLRKPGTEGHDPEDKLLDEAGDVLFYLTRLCQMKGTSLTELAQRNMEKLNKRHPEPSKCA